MPFLRAVLMRYRVLEGTAEWLIYIAPRLLVLCVIFRQFHREVKCLIRIGYTTAVIFHLLGDFQIPYRFILHRNNGIQHD